MMCFNKIAISLLLMPRSGKRAFVLLLDVGFCLLSFWLAYCIRFDSFMSLSENAIWAAFFSIFLAIPLFVAAGFYRTIFRYSGLQALMAVIRVILLYGLIFGLIFSVIGVPDIPRSIGLLQPMFLMFLVGASRVFAVWLLGHHAKNNSCHLDRTKILIYGAGSAGRQLAAAINHSKSMRVLGFLDDDERLQGHLLDGLWIYTPERLREIVEQFKISDVYLALPSISRKRRNEILTKIRKAGVSVSTLPSVTELAQGKISISDIRDLDIDDLLGRESVTPHAELMAKNIEDKVVLVTGAGGSIGSELCRQILSRFPKAILLLEQNEYSLYEIYMSLQEQISRCGELGRPQPKLLPLLGSIQNIERLDEIMKAWCPETVYHAAAYKHVPLVEHNPAEGVMNNVFGTLRVAQAAIRNGVQSFVLVSTDKAVRPTSIMGASKRLCEKILQALAETSLSTKFCMVRFGNVLGSSGSVVPRFRQQILSGGPITLTHPEITRYFMTIPEASQLVIQAGAMASTGDVFVLDMGEPVRIIDLAKKMIELSGQSVKDAQNPEGDIEIVITGLRPGEKLYEELLIGDNPVATEHPRIMKAREGFIPWSELEQRLAELEVALKSNNVWGIRSRVEELVSGYTPAGEVVDWVHMATKLNKAGPVN